MLHKLSISNYALIDDLEITFDSGLNILTGETGAGKSIILGALSLLLGQRAENRYFFNQQKKCIIEGSFHIKDFQLKDFFEDNDLDYDQQTLLRREISADGKSRAFVNDTPVNLNILRQIGEKLIDIHSQHAGREINDRAFQLLVIDAVAGHDSVVRKYRSDYKSFRQGEAELEKLIEERNRAKADLDYFQFQYDELEKANIIPGEQEKLEQELFALNHAGEIKRSLLSAGFLLEDGEGSAVLRLREAVLQLSSLEKFNTDIAALHDRLKSALIEIRDIATDISDIERRTHTDEQRAEEITRRLDVLFNLQKKHRAAGSAELILLRDELSDKIENALHGDEAIEKLQRSLDQDRKTLETLANEISAGRGKAIPHIQDQVASALAEMGMTEARLQIRHQSRKAEDKQRFLQESGIDEITFLFSANKGHPLAEMSKVASGGELSRVMLAVKSLVASHTALPTIIFDEIDAGVSGEVAGKVGSKMEQLAHHLQVITITHLPQIASKEGRHYFVYKDPSGETTYTRIRQLGSEERILEIAKMLSGDQPGEHALHNARELLHNQLPSAN